jgi:crotonobetainyl-CoA:carnitine CoA-transferase CaiB-like acyl-CoA transferase
LGVTESMSDGRLPLDGVRVVDLTDGVAAVAGRFLADLGADVVLVEPPEGVTSRRAHPRHDGHGLRFATGHFNKRGIVLDLGSAEQRTALLHLTDTADVVLESRPVGELDALGVGPNVMRQRNSALVVVSVTGFGQTGPYRRWRSSEAVLVAMSSALTRSGAAHREPLVPPGELGGQTAAIHCAFAALLAYYHARRTGHGQYVDCSLLDLVVQDLDPGFGMGGSASGGRRLSEQPPGRPDLRFLYPVIACADGYVRMFIGSAKQWRALLSWMGNPAEFTDAAYDQMGMRHRNWAAIRSAIEELFANKTRDEIVARGAELGIAVAALHTAAEMLDNDHVRQRESFARVEIAPNLHGAMANGCVAFDGIRMGFRHRAPRLDEHAAEIVSDPYRRPPHTRFASVLRPLQGIRVLDLGVIVVGGESGRELADQGADVIKVENQVFVDGMRQSDRPGRCGYNFAVGNRGKRSLGLNLRSAAGKKLFGELVAKSDVVLTNFRPGTMESLDLGYEELRAINPRIVMVESSAFGANGPWATRMGYGPLVRSAVGLTALWRHPDAPDGFGDHNTVYPDHAAARVGTAAVLAALIQRERTGTGCRIELSQMDTVFVQMATEYLRESLLPGTLVAEGNSGEFDAPSGVYRCAGEDAYCAVNVDGDGDWALLAAAIDRPDLAANPAYATAAGRVARRAELDAAVGHWAAPLTPAQAQQILQGAGVAAGAATHVGDLLTDPHLAARCQLGTLVQPGHDKPFDVTRGPALFDAIPEPLLRPAPLLGAATREICREVLTMSDSAIDELIDAGVLEVQQTPA